MGGTQAGASESKLADQCFFLGILGVGILRSKDAAEQCPLVKAALSLAAQRNPASEVLTRALAIEAWRRRPAGLVTGGQSRIWLASWGFHERIPENREGATHRSKNLMTQRT